MKRKASTAFMLERAAMQNAKRRRIRNVLGPVRVIPMRAGGYNGVRARKATGERKTIDLAPAAKVMDTTGTVTLLNGVATGADFTERIGRKIFMKSIYLTGIIFGVDDHINDTLCRILVVYDNQSNGAAPVMTDILKTSTSASQLNLDNRDRFKVIIDKRWCLARRDNTATQAFAGAPSCHVVKIFRRLNKEVLFNGTTNAVGSIATGSLYLLTIGNSAAGTGGTSELSARVRFIDQ